MIPKSNDKEIVRFERYMEKREANDSGRGPESLLPDELRGLNWGALLLNFVWGLAMRVPQTWLCLVPLVGIFWPLVMWVKGNDWAWRYRRWDSVEHFRRVQEKWAVAGLVLVVVMFVLSILLVSWINETINRMLTI